MSAHRLCSTSVEDEEEKRHEQMNWTSGESNAGPLPC